LCHGPPTDSGFFYDGYSGSDIFTEKNYKEIEKAAKKCVSEAQSFDRLVLTKEEALRLFGENPFKVSLISSKIPDGGRVTAYKCIAYRFVHWTTCSEHKDHQVLQSHEKLKCLLAR